MVLVLHHAIIDGWSIRILLDELAAIYEAMLLHRKVDLAPLGLHYVDYALWQCQQAGGGLWDDQLAYWTQQLKGAPELLDLPSHKVRPKVASGKGFKLPVHISAGAYKQLQALASSLQATPVMVALAAFQVISHPFVSFFVPYCACSCCYKEIGCGKRADCLRRMYCPAENTLQHLFCSHHMSVCGSAVTR